MARNQKYDCIGTLVSVGIDRDDRLNGKVCAAGFTSIEQARKAFEWQDLRRVAI